MLMFDDILGYVLLLFVRIIEVMNEGVIKFDFKYIFFSLFVISNKFLIVFVREVLGLIK